MLLKLKPADVLIVTWQAQAPCASEAAGLT